MNQRECALNGITQQDLTIQCGPLATARQNIATYAAPQNIIKNNFKKPSVYRISLSYANRRTLWWFEAYLTPIWSVACLLKWRSQVQMCLHTVLRSLESLYTGAPGADFRSQSAHRTTEDHFLAVD